MELAAPGCVNTVPEATLQAVAESGTYQGDTMSGRVESAAAIVAELSDLGIDIQAVCQQLEDAGVASFIDSWEKLRSTVASIMSS